MDLGRVVSGTPGESCTGPLISLALRWQLVVGLACPLAWAVTGVTEEGLLGRGAQQTFTFSAGIQPSPWCSRSVLGGVRIEEQPTPKPSDTFPGSRPTLGAASSQVPCLLVALCLPHDGGSQLFSDPRCARRVNSLRQYARHTLPTPTRPCARLASLGTCLHPFSSQLQCLCPGAPWSCLPTFETWSKMLVSWECPPCRGVPCACPGVPGSLFLALDAELSDLVSRPVFPGLQPQGVEALLWGSGKGVVPELELESATWEYSEGGPVWRRGPDTPGRTETGHVSCSVCLLQGAVSPARMQVPQVRAQLPIVCCCMAFIPCPQRADPPPG